MNIAFIVLSLMQKNNANVIYVGQTWLLNTCRVFRLPSVAFSMPGRILKRIFSKG